MNIPFFPEMRRAVLAAAALAVFLPLAAPPASAQASSSNTRPMTRAERAAQREKVGGKTAAAAKVEPLYPLATREEPTVRASRSGVKALEKLMEAYEKEDHAAVIRIADEIGADPASNAYDKGFAAEVAGNSSSAADNDQAAADYFNKAVESGGLTNNDHYSAMFNLAVVQFGLEQYPQALATVDRFLAETKTDKLEALKLRANTLLSMEKNDEAAAAYAKLLADHPDDKGLRMNSIVAYQQAGQEDKALEVMADALKAGQLTTAAEYRALYVTYINADRDKDALAVIEQGLASGALPADDQLARDYMVLGQKAYHADDLATAADMYARAAPIKADGEASLNLAKVLVDQGKMAESRAAAQQALQKGVKDTAGAKRLAGGK